MTKRISDRMSREDDGLTAQPVWRTGYPDGRGVYEQVGRRSAGDDQFLGLMDTPELAEHIVKLHNRVVADG